MNPQIIHPEALQEYIEAAKRFEEIRPNLGMKFRISVPVSRARKACAILADLGTDIDSLFNMLLVQVIKQRAIPFRIVDLDPETEEILRDPEAMAAINACREGRAGPTYTMEEVFGEQ